ncbi:MAG: hypothetical protein JWN26_684 [Candidatus Saccharibacteria bacterium]|nr:hypothetical protein [Candidatus Saccharibacteria bacterium]
MTATKKTIIMIHGFRGTHHGLQLIAEQLPEYNLTIPDLPGFAEGESLPSYDLDAYVLWLHNLIERQNLKKPPILLGHSFGSIITAAYAAKYPKTIEKLILVNPIGAPALEGPRAVLTQLALFYYWVGRKLPTRIANKWLAAKPVVVIVTLSMTKTKDKAVRAYIHNQHFRYFSLFHDKKSLSESFTTSVSHNVRETAGDISVPTLLIVGANDDITPLHKQKELVEMFSDGKLHVIKKVGHLTHYETPDQVADAIKNFTNRK